MELFNGPVDDKEAQCFNLGTAQGQVQVGYNVVVHDLMDNVEPIP